MRPQKHSDEVILRTARECFVELGPAVPTGVIAERLGVTQPSLFRRFGSKRELMIAALCPTGSPRWLLELQSGPTAAPFAEQLRAVALGLTRFFAEIAPRLVALRASGIPPAEVFAAYDEPPPLAALNGVTHWLERCQKRGLIVCSECRETAAAFLGAFQFPTFLAHTANLGTIDVDEKARVDAVVHLFCRALVPQAEYNLPGELTND